MGHQTRLVSELDMYKSQQALKQDLTVQINNVDDKVDNLRDMVLPLVESSKQTAENTRKIADSMDAFTREQRSTNGKLYTRLNDHDKELTYLGVKTKTQSEIKKANATIIVAIISIVGVVVGGIFALAPHLFN